MSVFLSQVLGKKEEFHMTEMLKIGFVGTGIMGKSMLCNLGKKGYEMHAYARHPEKIADLESEGVALHETLADCVKAVDVMISIVGFPKDVEAVYFGEGGIFNSAHHGQYIIDMTTTSPTLAKKELPLAFMSSMHRLQVGIRALKTQPFPSLSVVKKRIFRPCALSLRGWEPTSTTWDRLVPVSMPRWPTRS